MSGKDKVNGLLFGLLAIIATLCSAGTARAVALGEPPLEAPMRTSAAAELMHSASLIHDDVIDSEQIRRGQAALNVAYGNTVAVLVGDLYCTQFFWILSELEGLEPERKKRVTDLFLSATQRMCAAEIFEARLQRAGRQPSLHEYLEIIERKTADLMSACCEAAGLICGADEQAVGALGRFGMAIGMAYQVVDDALDRDASYADYRDILAHASTHGEEAMGCLDSLSPSAARDRLEAMVGYVLGKVRVLEARRA